MDAARVVAEPSAAPGERTGWQGSLDLHFAVRGERTVLAQRRHTGPLMVQSPFHPEGAPCHVYVLHPPGGLVGGDELSLTASGEPGSHALITTPAAAKVYRSRGPLARTRQCLRVHDGAVLEFLPGETIVFDGARCVSETSLELDSGAAAIAWEAWVLGRPAAQERFGRGELRQGLRVSVAGRPVLWERALVEGSGDWLEQPWGLGGHAAWATVLAWPGEGALGPAREAVGTHGGCEAAATLVDGLLVCRARASRLPALRAQMERWWQALRPAVVGRAASAPRVWRT